VEPPLDDVEPPLEDVDPPLDDVEPPDDVEPLLEDVLVPPSSVPPLDDELEQAIAIAATEKTDAAKIPNFRFMDPSQKAEEVSNNRAIGTSHFLHGAGVRARALERLERVLRTGA
jgi:hypothetical protein